MKVQVYCVRDRKAGTFWTPVFDRDHVQAIRSFEMSCRNSESQFAKWPGDFELLHLGEFDSKTGKFELQKLPLVLADPMQFVTGDQFAAGRSKLENDGVVAKM